MHRVDWLRGQDWTTDLSQCCSWLTSLRASPRHRIYRCSGGGAALPQPQLALESEGPLQYNEAEWEQSWVSQGGEQVYSVRLAVAGHPG